MEKWKLTEKRKSDTVGTSWRLEEREVLESLRVWEFLRVWRFCKVKKMSPSGILYRRRNWVGVIPFKILMEMSAVGSTSHRRIWGIKRCLEHLMRYRGFRSVRNSYRTHEMTLSHAEIRGTCEIFFLTSKPHFSSWIGRENWSFKGLLWGRRPKYIFGPWPHLRRHNGSRIDQ